MIVADRTGIAGAGGTSPRGLAGIAWKRSLPIPILGRMLRRAASLFVLVAAGCSAAPPAQPGLIPSAPASTLRERLASDDILNVTVYGHLDLSSGRPGSRVDHDGNIDLPLIGPVQVVGLTVSEARDAIAARAARYVSEPRVSVSVLQYAPRMVYVLGTVRVSGGFELARPMTALQALSLGGGFASGADHEEIALLRRRGDELEVSFFNAATPGVDGMVAVEPGDVLFVRRSGAGSFREQILPYLQGLGGPLAALGSLILIADRVDE